MSLHSHIIYLHKHCSLSPNLFPSIYHTVLLIDCVSTHELYIICHIIVIVNHDACEYIRVMVLEVVVSGEA